MQKLKLTNFDRTVLAIMAVLVLAIVTVIVLGDNVGVRIVRTAPEDEASSTSPIAIQFSEVMDWDSVAEHLRLEPDVAGDLTWTGMTARFQPGDPLTPGETYTVVLDSGAESRSGRRVLDDVTFDFRVRTPRVAYLAPSDAVPQNVWIADPAVPDSAEQVTNSPSGVVNFDISPDGRLVAFAERNPETGTSDIKLLDLETGALRQLTNCVDADCNTPVFRPDGQMIAYHRIDLNSDLDNVGVSPTRVWLIDLTANPATTRPLFDDRQILSYAPQWSADGNIITVFDNASRGILIYDFANDDIAIIPSRNGGSEVALSPDGQRVVFPRLIFDEAGGARASLQIAEMDTGLIRDLSDPSAPIDDSQTAWNPDNRHLVIARRYVDERYTRTRQLYLMDVDTGDVDELVFDERYYNGWFSWDPQGTHLVIQRFPELTEAGETNPNGRPEIWTLDAASGDLTQVAVNAYHPRWVP